MTKSSQNWIPPLIDSDPNQNLNIDGYLKDIISKDKWGSDSLSEDNDKSHIVREMSDEEEEEKRSYSSHNPSKKLSNESSSKKIKSVLRAWFIKQAFERRFVFI